MSDKQTEALKLALEALNELIPDVHDWYGAKVHRANAAITAIREALTEQPAQQKPTCKQNLQVWVISNGKGRGQFSWEPQDERYWTRMEPAIKQDLTPEQPAQQQEIEELTTQRDNLADILTRTANVLKGQPAREHIGDSGRVLIQPIGPVVCHQPAAQTDECVVCGDKVRVIPRPWVGLTKEDRYKAIRPLYCDDATAALAACHSNDEYEAIEAKLREKNA